jgi:hypothetical protein
MSSQTLLNVAPAQGEKTAQEGEVIENFGAGDGDRTHDVQLGKLAFYR